MLFWALPNKENMALHSLDFGSIDPQRLEDAISQFKWYNDNPPQDYYIEAEKGLQVIPKPNTDFWRRTYEIPPADRCIGHALLYKMPSTIRSWEAATKFSLSPFVRYDHAGIMLFVDEKHWLKAGTELENGLSLMSCVVTNEESDWNYLTLPSFSCANVRISCQRYDLVCECKVEYEENGQWTFLREAPIFLGNPDASVYVGPMCCAPGEKGTKVTFHNLEIKTLP